MRATMRMMAGYNRWANERVYAAAAVLDDEARRRDVGAFFGSLHATLNHVLVADRIWMKRFTGEGPGPYRLDEILFEDFVELRDARAAEDERISAYIRSLDEDTLAGLLRYRAITNPTDIEQPLLPALMHFFNHQTHHRGQMHAILTQLAGRDAAPSLDLVLYQRETGVGLV